MPLRASWLPSLYLASFLLLSRMTQCDTPEKRKEEMKMQLGKKKTAISLAVGTLLLALLTISSYGRASKCSSDCTAPNDTFAGSSIENLYSAVSYAADEAASSGVVKTKAVPSKLQVRAKVNKLSGENEKVLKRTLVAILLLCATESHRITAVSN